MPVLLILLATLLAGPAAGADWELPPLPPPEEFGNLLIDRGSTESNVEPVTFSHWSHRRRYTCRVCHTELDFAFKRNVTEITEAENRAGKYCGACHDGKTAFGHDRQNCEKCHNGNPGYGKERFRELSKLPKAPFGNRIDWVAAVENLSVTPARSLKVPPPPAIPYNKTLLLEAEKIQVPPAVFPHKAHTAWLDCNNCHPEIFNTKKKTTKHFEMKWNLAGEFCGICHMTVAFPMNDCKRCHRATRR